uniref:C2H2-type domain-containing protein n=1 Tax=Mycena chlorophos TaxID=658473 RepID=A0ABQ0M4Y5_MYCCL|nr:predicted protein [Mycena chlorophos]
MRHAATSKGFALLSLCSRKLTIPSHPKVPQAKDTKSLPQTTSTSVKCVANSPTSDRKAKSGRGIPRPAPASRVQRTRAGISKPVHALAANPRPSPSTPARPPPRILVPETPPAPARRDKSTLLRRLDQDRRRLTQFAPCEPRAPPAFSLRHAPRERQDSVPATDPALDDKSDDASAQSADEDSVDEDGNIGSTPASDGEGTDADESRTWEWVDKHADFHRIRWNFQDHPVEGPCSFSRCKEASCPGCACICRGTVVWIEHWGGHHRKPPRGCIFG